ncbi:C40 family peptidase [Streptomyces shaanxiensis]|uniref:C40 family peptidase n=2 Tax=Streptomyces shaanxiensis TaxID=653357 RepID=A0ABP7WBW6_9ACTN
MAPERTARPGALSLPGMRNSALASAALTSVALLAQTANAAPSAGDEAPSREEVSRRVSSLYDQAESDTGTFNATRAAATGPRKRADRPTDAGRRPVGEAGSGRSEESRRSDPALDNVARQWFDVARSKLGPTVPAALPRDRMPDRPTGTRPARSAERALEGLTELGREPSGRAALELPAAPVAELPAAGATGTAPMAELTAGPIAALPPAPEAPPALPAPTADPQRSPLRTTKEQNQRKLDRARELLSAYTVRQSMELTPLEAPLGQAPAADTWSATPAPVQPSAETQWQALQDLGASDLTPVPAGTTAWSGTAVQPAYAPSAAATDQSTAASQVLDTGQTYTTGQALGTGQPYTTGQSLDTGQTYATSQPFDTSTALTTVTATTATTAPQDTRAMRALDFARAQIGKPCVWGTTGPDAYDGGGLAQAAWRAAGITLPRTPQEQATAGRGIALTYAEPGDLVLFHVGHVGIYSGNGMMIHAPGPGRVIREEPIDHAGESAIHSVIRPA